VAGSGRRLDRAVRCAAGRRTHPREHWFAGSAGLGQERITSVLGKTQARLGRQLQCLAGRRNLETVDGKSDPADLNLTFLNAAFLEERLDVTLDEGGAVTKPKSGVDDVEREAVAAGSAVRHS